MLLPMMFMVTCGANVPHGYSETDYGLVVESGDFAEFNRLEKLAVEVAIEYKLSERQLKDAMDWIMIVYHPADDDGSWYSDWHKEVIFGYAECEYHKITMGKPTPENGGICKSAFFHELLHFYEKCVLGGHVEWKDRGWYDADKEFTKRCLEEK
jgi:hypothetical protein